MKCPGCDSESFDLFQTCKYCGVPLGASAAAPGAPPLDPAEHLLNLRLEPERLAPGHGAPGHGAPGRGRSRTTGGSQVERDEDFVEMLDDDGVGIRENDLETALAISPGSSEAGDEPLFRIDDALFTEHDSGAPEVTDSTRGAADWSDLGSVHPAGDTDLPETFFAQSGEDLGNESGGEPVIDHDEEVPERYWAPEVAGLGRRALALLADQSLLLAVLGIFFLAAFLALRLNGFDTGLLLAASGLRASALPFALLAAVLSLAYSLFFHWSAGRTPGKALVGVEVRTGDAGTLTWGRVLLRWLGAALGLACAGVGIFWAFFEPRRRGWADLISGTVVARRRGARR